jgi:hypothetical protein
MMAEPAMIHEKGISCPTNFIRNETHPQVSTPSATVDDSLRIDEYRETE